MGPHREPEPIVENVMSSPVLTVGPRTTLAEAAQVMVEGHVGCVVVLEGPRVVGILTERDILRWLRRGDPAAVRTGDAMSSPVVTVDQGTHCAEALETMVARGIRRLPVVDDEGSLLGIVTERDLMGWLLDNPDEFTEVLRTTLPETDPETIREAILEAAMELRHRRDQVES